MKYKIVWGKVVFESNLYDNLLHASIQNVEGTISAEKPTK